MPISPSAFALFVALVNLSGVSFGYHLADYSEGDGRLAPMCASGAAFLVLLLLGARVYLRGGR